MEKDWLEGMAICLHCDHVWDETIIRGGATVEIECPKCSLNKGVFHNLALPESKEITYLCDCGKYLGYHTKQGFVCCFCGKIHDIKKI